MTTMTFFARGDSNTAKNAALNAQGVNKVPTTVLTFQSTAGGDIVLDYSNGDPDPDTVVLVNGVERSFWVEFSGTLPNTNKLKNVNGQDLRGQEVVVITADNGQRYFFLTSGDGDLVTMTAFPNGAHALENYQTTANVYICFVTGTLISTPRGEVPVEHLRPGDEVVTASGEVVPILWASKRDISIGELICRPESRPVCVKKGSFGTDMPNRDLWLSQMHRVLVRGWEAELLFGQNEVFVHSGHLPPTSMKPYQITAPVTYHHILMERHCVLISNGLETESLFPGDIATASLDDANRSKMTEALAAHKKTAKTFGTTARTSLRRWEAELLFDLTGANQAAPAMAMVNLEQAVYA